MLLTCNKIAKAFTETRVIEDASFFIEEYEHVALVGPNGSGKSTLLKIIAGVLKADKGTTTFSKGKTLGYLSQHQEMDDGGTIYSEVECACLELLQMENQIRAIEEELKYLTDDSLKQRLTTYNNLINEFERRNGYALHSEITGILKGLGFEESEFDKEVRTLSGGQKTRVALSRLLLTKPDLLILDEPTNHLDLRSVAWLENYLNNYAGAVLVVSHDRYFLNKVVTKVLDMDQGILQMYRGNYESFAKKRSEIRKAKQKAYIKQQQEIKHHEEVIEKLKSFNREKSIKRAESREKMLSKINRLDEPTEINTKMNLRLAPKIESGKDVLAVHELSKSFHCRPLFSHLSFEIKRGEHVALIGDNGTGKTTLLKIINGLIPPDFGKVVIGAKVFVGYYDQEYHELHNEKTIFTEISDEYPGMTQGSIRNVLAAFLFTGDDVFKPIHALSGGEKGRVSLAKLMLADANFLILDEPTNHLDVDSKEILEEALNEYTGTIFYVSHDRYFINQTANRILELTEQGINGYLGNYDYYLEKKEEQKSIMQDDNVITASDSKNKRYWQEQKERKAKEQKRQNDLKKCEEQIFLLEAQNEDIDNELLKEEVYTDSVLLQGLTKEKDQLDNTLSHLYKEWEELQS